MFLQPSIAVIKIGLDPVLVRFGPISVHWYGLMYVVGLAAGLRIMIRYAQELGVKREDVYDVFWPVLIGSLAGGRLYYVVQSDLGRYLRHPQDILATWEGGMAFYGAVFLGTATLYVVTRAKGIPFGKALDIATVLIPSAQVFGRIGNLINGDIIGYASSLPWATQYTNPHNTFVPSHSIAYDPAAAYELLFSALLFAAVWKLRHRFPVPGTLFVLWLVLYSVGQFLLFFLRANSVVLLGLKQAQITAVVVVVAVIPAWLVWRRYYERSHPGIPGSPATAHAEPSSEALPGA